MQPLVEDDKPLDRLNTFGFSQRAEHYAEAPDEDTLVALLELAADRDWPVFVLGGGSNIVLTRDVIGLVIRLTGARVLVESADSMSRTNENVLVTVDAGVDWHEFVIDMLQRGHDGLENLSLIPGTVGASPVQNIGAYGVELMDRIHSIRAWHVPTGRFVELDAPDCGFAYRDSRFKRERGDWIITGVRFVLGLQHPRVTDYATLAAALQARCIASPTARDVSDAVMAIRRDKLPDPAVIGNAGSFFHNPIVDSRVAGRLASEHPDLVSWPLADGRRKLAAGWLVDRLGYRGLRRGAVGVHSDQALVMVNDGGGTGHELMALVGEIVAAVRETYGVLLVVEPVVM